MLLYRNLKKAIWLFVPYLLLPPTDAAAMAFTDSRTEYELGIRARQYIINNFRPVQEQALIQRVNHIIQRIVRVADTRRGIEIEALVIEADQIGAWAFPGGFICLTKPLIDLCENDDELAVILGHEVAHEVKGHVDAPIEERVIDKYRDLLTEMTDSGKGFIAEYAAKDFTNEITRQKEFEADQYGILYAAMAGFDVSAAFSILAKVMEEAERQKNLSRSSYQERRTRIAYRLKKILDMIDVFHAGVRFLQRNEYPEALEAFRNFLAVFPSREVYNNIGVAFHKRALSNSMVNSDCEMMKTIRIDLQTLAERIKSGTEIRSLETDPYQVVKTDLQNCIKYYRQAIQQDPKYTIAYNNIGCAYDDLGQYDHAELYLKLAIRQDKNCLEAINNLGVVRFHQNKTVAAQKLFRDVLASDRLFVPAIFNMATCFERQQQIAESQRWYKTFLSLSQSPNNRWVNKAKYKLKTAGIALIDRAPLKRVEQNFTPCINKLCLRDSIGELKAKFGEPDREVMVLPSRSVSALVFSNAGITVLVQRKKIVNIVVKKSFAPQIHPSFKLGSPMVKVIDCFGQPDTIQTSGDEVIWHTYDLLGIRFGFHNDFLKAVDIYETNRSLH